MAPTIAWVTLALGNILGVTGYDLWAHYTNHETMSGRFHDWMLTVWGGPVLFALLAAIPLALGWHFITYHRPR